MRPSVWPIRRGISSSAGRPSRQRPSRTMRSCSIVRRCADSSSIIAWSATSSMKVSGQLVTGMPRAVAAATSTLSTPTLPSTMARHLRRQPVHHLLGEAHALGVDRVGILGEPDKSVLVGRTLDDFGVDPFQRLHFVVIAAAGGGEAGPGGGRYLEFCQLLSPMPTVSLTGKPMRDRPRQFRGGRARTAFSFTSMPQPGPLGRMNSPFSIVGTVV